jgi:ribosome maturation factor RimP
MRGSSGHGPSRPDQARRPASPPADAERLTTLLEPVAGSAGMDLESVRISAAGRRWLLRIVVDADNGPGLDEIALVSRAMSAELDASGVMGEAAYTLEVSSPGVDRPLTEPRHWRRAARRLVKVKVPGEGSVVGRVLAADDNGVTLDVDGSKRELEYSALGPGTVQVEFGRIPDADELAADDGLLDQDLDDDELDEFEADEADEEELDDELDDEAKLGAGGDGH